MKTIKIQPKEQADMTLPYPYFINEEGLVGRQDFWKGNPTKLIAFTKNPKINEAEISFEQFWKNPEKAIGLYPVFQYKDGNWRNDLVEIESIIIK